MGRSRTPSPARRRDRSRERDRDRDRRRRRSRDRRRRYRIFLNSHRDNSEGPLVNNYCSTLRLLFRLMMSKKDPL